MNWIKSSFSGGQPGSDCVEVAALDAGAAVRDSKNPAGAVLCFASGEWSAFLSATRSGDFV